MQYIAVISKTGKRLMPCTSYRANELIRKGKAIRRFDRGLFYIKLTQREDGEIQPIAVGIDPGSKKEGFTIKSNKHTFFNLQADAVTWVKKSEETSTMMRRSRRNRKCPCRKPKLNKKKGSLCPSTRARWGLKLRISNWINRYYPISVFVVEDIKASPKYHAKKWNKSFSPLEVGKQWFYEELGKIALVKLKQGFETFTERNRLGLKKLSNKMSNKFEAHCVDSWVLANLEVQGHKTPDNKNMMYLIPIRLHRRQLHALQPIKGGVRRDYGGTMSLGLKRGSWVKNKKYGVCYVGGSSKGKISLHEIKTGKRLTRSIKVKDCVVLTRSSWRVWKQEKENACNSPHG